MELEMTITQGDNGWIIEYTGRDGLDKKVITPQWGRVIKEAEEYFGWYGIGGKLSKELTDW